jgi:hypothetical protein
MNGSCFVSGRFSPQTDFIDRKHALEAAGLRE